MNQGNSEQARLVIAEYCGGETVAWCDAGHQGVHKREENLGREVEWQVETCPGKRRALGARRRRRRGARHGSGPAWVGAKVERPFLKVKRVFGYCKVRYGGQAKNTGRMALFIGLGDPLMAEGQLGWLIGAQWA